jgi:hypothetical protein
MLPADPARIRSAWQGGIFGCLLGKPVELLSMREGRDALSRAGRAHSGSARERLQGAL